MADDWSATYAWQGNSVIEGVQSSKLTVFDGAEAAGRFVRGSQGTAVELQNFPPGSVLVLKTRLATTAQVALEELRTLLSNGSALRSLQPCSLLDLNVIMYRCEQEEQATTRTGCYVFPEIGAPLYCGIVGLCRLLELKVTLCTPFASSKNPSVYVAGGIFPHFLISNLSKGGGRSRLRRVQQSARG